MEKDLMLNEVQKEKDCFNVIKKIKVIKQEFIWAEDNKNKEDINRRVN